MKQLSNKQIEDRINELKRKRSFQSIMLREAQDESFKWVQEINELEKELESRKPHPVPDEHRYFLVRMPDLVELLQAEADLKSLYAADVERWDGFGSVEWQEPMSLDEFNEGPNNADAI